MAALTTASLTAASVSPSQAADPTSCPFPAADTYVFKTAASGGFWSTPGSWTIPANHTQDKPDDRMEGVGDPDPSYACIPSGVTVRLDKFHDFMEYVEGLYLAPGAVLDIDEGTGVLVMGTTIESYAAPGSQILVDQGTFGGTGTVRTRGTVEVRSSAAFGSSLSSTSLSFPDPGGAGGKLVVAADGRLSLPSLGTNIFRRYQVQLDGTGALTSNGFLAVDQDSVLTVGTTGVLEFGGSGGFYESGGGGPVSLVNNGVIRKSGTGTTSIIGSDYVQTGTVAVAGGTLAFAGGTTYGAQVSGGQQLSTEKCALPLPADRTPCVVETRPSVDPSAISLRIPAGDADGAEVVVDEVAVGGQPAARTTARKAASGTAIFEGIADAAGLNGSVTDPAVIEIRVAASLGQNASTDSLTVGHGDGALPTCRYRDGAPPAGSPACVARALRDSSAKVTRLAADGNYYVVIRAIGLDRRANRWIVTRESGDVTGPVLTTPAQAEVRHPRQAGEGQDRLRDRVLAQGEGLRQGQGQRAQAPAERRGEEEGRDVHHPRAAAVVRRPGGAPPPPGQGQGQGDDRRHGLGRDEQDAGEDPHQAQVRAG